MVVTIIAMVLYIAIIPVWEVLYPLMVNLDLDPTNPNHIIMTDRINTAWDLWLILPVISIGIAVIFFVMRTIRQQAYSDEQEQEFR